MIDYHGNDTEAEMEREARDEARAEHAAVIAREDGHKSIWRQRSEAELMRLATQQTINEFNRKARTIIDELEIAGDRILNRLAETLRTRP